MNEIIVKWWADRGLHIDKLVAKRPNGISPEQVADAAVLVCGEVTKGEIPDTKIKLAREVWNLARTLKADSQIDEYKRLVNAQETIINQNASIQELIKANEKINIKKTRNHWLWFIFLVITAAGSFYIGYIL